MSFFLKHLKVIQLLMYVIISVFFMILIYKELKPSSSREKVMGCLKLGSDARAAACLKLLNADK